MISPFFPLIGLLGLSAMIVVNVAALGAARYFLARAFGVVGVGPFFTSGRDTSFDGISRWARPVIVAGAAMAPYAVAAALFFTAYLMSGREVMGNRVKVIPGRPADAAGMRDWDRVLTIGDRKIETWEQLSAAVREHPGEPVEVGVERAGAELHLTLTPGARGTAGEGKIGVVAVPERVEVGVGTALGRSLVDPGRVLVDVLRGLASTITGQLSAEMSGPAGIAAQSGRAARSGAGDALLFLGSLNAYFLPGFALLSLIFMPRKGKAAGEPR